MSQRFLFLALICCGLVVPTTSIAKERSVENFTKYVARRLVKTEDSKLAEFVARVDKNSDGVISDEEFANRIAAYQQVFQKVQVKATKRGHGLPENWLTNFDEAIKQSQETGKPIVAMYSASWCGPCKWMIATVYPTEEASKALEDFVPVYIDCEKHRDLATQNKIRAFPTFKVFTNEGVEAATHVGASNTEGFIELLTEFHAAAIEKLQEGSTNADDSNTAVESEPRQTK